MYSMMSITDRLLLTLHESKRPTLDYLWMNLECDNLFHKNGSVVVWISLRLNVCVYVCKCLVTNTKTIFRWNIIKHWPTKIVELTQWTRIDCQDSSVSLTLLVVMNSATKHATFFDRPNKEHFSLRTQFILLWEKVTSSSHTHTHTQNHHHHG